MKHVPLLLLWATLSLNASPPALLTDRFDRDVTERGIQLTDWEGHIANPALRYFLAAPPDLTFPVSATLRINNPRVYFESSLSQVSPAGPARNFAFADAGFREPFLISLFPDRDTLDEQHQATVIFTDINQATRTFNFPVHVRDQDRARTNDLNIIVNFTQDETGFFADIARRNIVQQAANDWAYFFQGGFDAVPSFTELSFIWDKNGAVAGRRVFNEETYTGFLLYVYGVFHPELRSGGQGSYDGEFQTINGAPAGLRRSGNYHADPRGNFNQLGWFLTQSDDDWWQTGNFNNEPNDLYSIAHHEIGHAFGFDQSYPALIPSGGALQSQRLLDYFADDAPYNASAHFDGLEDPASRKGIFGWEYFGTMVRRRWLITKLDLLCLEAIGYKLRDTTPFQTITAANPAPAKIVVSRAHTHDFGLAGGVPPYNATITLGALPLGVQLDPFTGALSGTPNSRGQFEATMTIADSGNPQITKDFPLQLIVTEEIIFTLNSLQTTSQGGLKGDILSPSSTPYVIEVSSDLSAWTPFLTNQLGGNYHFENPSPGPAPRFYRAKAQ